MNWSKRNEKGRGITPAPIANNRRTGNRPTEQRYQYIPVDFIKGKIVGMDLSEILNNPKLSFGQNIDPETGEIIPRIDKKGKKKQDMKMAEFEGIKLFYYMKSRTMYFSGSLHKYWNGGKHNYNDFNHFAFLVAIEKLFRHTGIRPENIQLTCLEFGVNITPPIDCASILNACIEHRCVDIEQIFSSKRGKYHQAFHDRYIVKIYDKGEQYGLSEKILRIEIKQSNWSPYRTTGLRTLQDFIDCDKTTFVDKLVVEWLNFIFVDPTALKKGEYDKSEAKRYWQELRPREKRNIKSKRLKELRNLNETQGENIQGQIAELIIENIRSLQKVTNSNLREKMVCPVTGMDITHQRKGSILLSHSGLRYIRDNNPKKYFLLSYQFLSDKWQNSPVEVQIKEIAHNIRNRFYNRRRPTRQTAGVGQIPISF